MVATKALDDKDLDLSSSVSVRKVRLSFIRASFIIAWLTFSLVIFIIAALVNLDLMRPSLEQIISQSIHRNVKLGRLSWNFGLHGFAVDTSRLLVAERSGEPFLMASNCEIGFSLWPLLIGVTKIQYVNLQKPLFMAVHTAPKKWNFDDMLVASPDIDFIQIKEGHIFVVDRQPSKQNRFSDIELNDVQIKLQRAGPFLPAQVNVAFNLAEREETATMSLEGVAWGEERGDWWDKNCHAELKTKGFTVENWQTIIGLLSPDSKNQASSYFISKLSSALEKFSSSSNCRSFLIPSSGQFDFHVTADGVPSKRINTDLQFKANHLIIHPQDSTIIELPQTAIAAQIEFKPNYFAWNHCVIRIPDYKLLFNISGSNTGATDKKQETNQCSIVGLFGDLKKLNSLFVFIYNNIPSNIPNGKPFDTKSLFSNLSGKLFLDLRFNSEQGTNQYMVEAKANDVNVDGIKPLLVSINKLTVNNAKLIDPFQSDFYNQLNISKQALFSGTIIGKSAPGQGLGSGKGLVLKDCCFKDDELSWKLSGQLDADGHWQELTVSNNQLQLNKLAIKLNHDAQLARRARTFLGLQPDSKIDLTGKAQVLAKIKAVNTADRANQASDIKSNAKSDINCEIKFDNAGIKLSQPQLEINNLSGLYVTNSTSVICKNLHFNVGNGSAIIDASISNNKRNPLRFNLQAKNIDMMDLREILSLFHFDTKCLDNWHLAGKLADIGLTVSGTTGTPIFAITASPTDVVFFTPSVKQPIHASGGKLTYINKVFSAERITLSIPTAKALISMVLKNPGNAGKLEKLNIRVTSTDLGELQNYIAATHLPTPLLAEKYQLANIKGNASASIDYTSCLDKQKLTGIIEFDGLNFKLGQQKLSCKNLKGKALLADSDLILHDVTGSIDNTSLALHGRLVNYTENTKDKPLQWRGEIAAQVAPENLSTLLSMGMPQGQKPYFNMQARKPIFIKLKTYTRNIASNQSFIVMADADAGFSISFGNMILNQPKRKLIINGLYALDDQKLTWRNLNFDFSDGSISLQGVINNYRNTKLDPTYDLQIQTSDFIPALYCGQIFSNDIISGALTGQIKGNLSLQGSAKSPSLTGKIFFVNLAIPESYLDNMVGTISFQPGQAGTIPALLQMDKFTLGPVLLTQSSGNLIWKNDLSQLSLKNFKSRLSSGQFNSDALFDLKAKKMHLSIDVNDANLTQLWPQLTSSQIKATGSLSCNLNVNTSGSTAKELEQNMVGSGHIHASHGSFSRLSQLHAKLNQVNLLRQGIFGFNFNNVMQSVLPSKASEFDSIDSAFALDQEVLTIRHILYDGKDIKFSTAGKVNLALHTLDLDVAGITPRVSNSILGGKLGEISREITLQKLLDGITMHKLEKLPSLPLIGGIAGGPEVFTCRIVAPYDQPKMISQSIEKSFHWLHSR